MRRSGDGPDFCRDCSRSHKSEMGERQTTPELGEAPDWWSEESWWEDEREKSPQSYARPVFQGRQVP